jgi:hypothetical protein
MNVPLTKCVTKLALTCSLVGLVCKVIGAYPFVNKYTSKVILNDEIYIFLFEEHMNIELMFE